MESENIYCSNCGELMKFSIRDRSYRLGDGPACVITNIPAYECWNCGEVELTPDGMQLINGELRVNIQESL